MVDREAKRDIVVKKSIFEMFPRISISRKKFIKLCGMAFGSLTMNQALFKFAFGEEAASEGRPAKNIKGNHDLVVIKGEGPFQMTVKAIEAMGGMERFVKKNSAVLIKPNMAWDRTPEQAANTNPEVVAALTEMCFRAGARRVNIFDRTCNEAQRCYKNSGIANLAKEKGANVYFVDEWNAVKANFKYKSPMQNRLIYRDAIECDTFINVPILKHHGLTGLTLSMKNLMGVCGGNRSTMHLDIGTKLAHLTDFIKPDLTVIDAYRVLKDNGPSGGRLEDVIEMKTLIVGTDPVLCDSYACKLMDKDPLSISYIKEAARQGLGTIDIINARIMTLSIP